MKGLVGGLLFGISVILLTSANPVFAQSTYIINIPTGSASPDAPFFWQSEKDGSTTGNISVKVLDSVQWENADTAAHTVTSGTPEEGPDGIFDSSLFQPGKSFRHQFTEAGSYEYFCMVHPWMVGVVTVTSGMEIIPNVGFDAGDGQTTFDVEYEFNRVITSASVNEEQKAITFEIVGRPTTEDNTLTLMLPKNLISGISAVWVDGEQRTDYQEVSEGGINILSLDLNEQSEQITIVGASVVPEFGTIAALILGVAIISTIVITTKTRIGLPYH